jgi:glycosyltransferase involved in cell wall biosynthesis
MLTIYILFAVLLLTFIIQLGFYLIPYTAILRYNRRLRKGNVPHVVEQPSVSIIICARNEGNNIKRFLPLVLEQNYHDYEVIIVNDGSCDDTDDIIKELQKDYDNLYVTNIPQETRIISHKKLAITVGVKAAKNEILLFTDADCRMTVMLLAGDLIKYDSVEEDYDGTYLMFDVDAIENNDEYSMLNNKKQLFTTMFGEMTISDNGFADLDSAKKFVYGDGLFVVSGDCTMHPVATDLDFRPNDGELLKIQPESMILLTEL